MAALHSFAQKYLLCAKCFFAPQSDALFWLINFSQMAYSAVMLAWHDVQAQIHTWRIMETFLNALNRTRFLTDFTTMVLKGFSSVAFLLTICSRVYRWGSICARSYDYVRRNIKTILVCVFIVCAYLAFWQFFHF